MILADVGADVTRLGVAFITAAVPVAATLLLRGQKQLGQKVDGRFTALEQKLAASYGEAVKLRALAALHGASPADIAATDAAWSGEERRRAKP